jgi:hypothetical protein
MALMDKIREPAVGGGIAGGLLVIAVLVVLLQKDDDQVRPVQTTGWYYDLKKNELFVGVASQLPPIPAPSDQGTQDKSGVRAVVFACGSCAVEADRFIAYLERFTDEARQANAQGQNIGAKGREIREEKGTQWVEIESEEGKRVLGLGPAKCKGLGKTLEKCKSPI